LRDIFGLVAIGWPLMLNNLFNIGINVADTVMAGRLGAIQLAAVALGTSIWITLFLGGLGVIMALGPTVAQHYGAGRMHAIGHDTRQGLWLAVAVSAVLIIAMRSVSPVLRWMDIEAPVVILAQGYLDALSWGAPGACLYHVIRQMSEGTGRTIPIMVVMGTSLPINIALNYIFMFGKFGSPALGAVGAGLGSAITFWLMLLMIVLYTYRAGFYRSFQIWISIERPDWRAIRRLVAIGLPIGMSLMLQAGLFSAVALLMGSLGTNVVAAHQIALNVAAFIFMVPLGLGMATTVRVGQAIGRQEPAAAARAGFVGIGVCAAITCISAVCTFLYASTIAGLYTSDTAVLRLAIPLIMVAALLQVGDAAQAAAAGALRGLKDTRVPLLINALIYWCIGFTMAYVFGIYFELGARGIWYGLVLALWIAAVALTLRFAVVMRRKVRAAVRPASV
jgi:MATE family multidrug resistance protein